MVGSTVTGFFHGVHIQYVDTFPRSGSVIRSNIIFIVGTADSRLGSSPAEINVPIFTQSDREDFERFGPSLDGFTLGHALGVLRDYECGPIWVVNVFDPAVHRSPAVDVDYVVDDNLSFQLHRVDGGGVKTGDRAHLVEELTLVTAGGVSLVEGTDYIVGELGRVKILPVSGVVEGDTLTATYDYPDPALVTSAEIIGAVTAQGRTGLQAVHDVYEISSGDRPKLILAPWYSHERAVAVELQSAANPLHAVAFIDSPPGTLPDEAVLGRNGIGSATSFNFSDPHLMLAFCPIRNSAGAMVPYSVHLAGRRSLTDVERGYWASISNQPLRNAVQREQRFTSDFTRQDTDANRLNSKGITVPAQFPNAGLISWGNRNSLYPADQQPLSFEAVFRNLYITLESAQEACLPFVGRPLIRPIIDQVLTTLNGLVQGRVLVGALYEGSEFLYLDSSNSPLQSAGGVLVIDYRFGMPSPAERIELVGTLDINLYGNLGGSN